MNRRRFINTSSTGLAGMLLLPSFLQSCKKENPYDDIQFKGSVGIVGAGAAGLYAAYLLSQKGINVQIFEASDRIGGRIRSLTGFSDFDIDLGAETIHGEHSAWYDLVRKQNGVFITSDLKDYYYINDQLLDEDQAASNPDFAAVSAAFDAISTYTESDIPPSAYANTVNLPESVRPIFNAWTGNENGTDYNRIGMSGLYQADQLWSAGVENLMLQNSDLLTVIESAFSSVLSKVTLETPISSIDYSTGKVKLTDTNGAVYEKDRVIVTSSIKVLFDQVIDFIPNLPPLHLQAINTLGMGDGLKIILKFNEAFWPANTGSVIGPGPVPEFWTTASGGRSDNNNLLTAFVNGENAESLIALGDAMIPAILAQLDTFFGNNVATTNYADHFIMNWADLPYIRGAYSYPKPGVAPETRGLLKEPVQNKIYFAGEAAHDGGHHGTVHGAMESALSAVTKILTTA